VSFVVVGLAALFVSGLTLSTGFGLGTLLLPAFALFFPLSVAVAATAVVHGANNLFKVILLHKDANRGIILRFGLPAIVAAVFGAWLLTRLSGLEPLLVWQLAGREAVITPLGLIMGTLIVGFALLDLAPGMRGVSFGTRWLPVGGVLSGFFGGLSGHQGALRAAFLGRLALTPPAFAATQAVIGFLVDAVRLTVYGAAFWRGGNIGLRGWGEWSLVGTATLCAFCGALIGKKLLPKVTVASLRYLTGTLLLVVGIGLGTGLL
jgi:uncharacterized membrane protein YfcA